ncbi:MAG: DUF2306 domain-containing protein [Cyclobacteriaceae bacterium]|nr:DUF2306 domain-containing protein [Cyclobacteriaceae bacterium]
MQRKIRNWLAMLTLTFFTILMVKITIPYLSLERDVAFLKIKQWMIQNDIWRFSFFTHVFSSVFLLLAGFTQFYKPLNRKIHRSIGKIYIILIVFISGPAGLVMSWFANGGLPSQTAFVLLSILWIFFTAKAYSAIRNKDFISHGNFMIRSYALTISAITLRSWKYLLVLFFHPHPMDAYMMVAWLGWVPNLLIAELLIRNRMSNKILST